MGKVSDHYRHALGGFVDLILPPRCPLCGEMVLEQGGFCGDCWPRLRFISAPQCGSCGRPLGADRTHLEQDQLICGPCLAEPPPHDGIRAVAIYDDLSRRIALRLKHAGRIGLAKLIAAQLLRQMPDLEEDWLLVPVPLHRWRLWRRGFNQSQLIASQLAHMHGTAISADALLRTKATPPLKNMTLRQRKEAVKNVFAVNPKKAGQLSGRKIMLVDDVYTSGATSHACVKVLKKAGASRVEIMCWARVLRDGEAGLEAMH
jgi:ComF family protein